MNTRTALLILLVTPLVIHSGISQAVQADDATQAHNSILGAARLFLESQLSTQNHAKIDIQMGRIDPRLRLQQCQQPLDTFLAPGSKTIGKTTVGVRCRAPKPWALYVSANINLYTRVYQTARPLDKNHIITAQDILPVEYNIARLNYGYFADQSNLLGKQTRRRLQQGRVITPNQVKPPLLVKRGEQVALVAKTAGFTVRMSGKAMMDGAQGDHIRVKNLSSKRIIEGTVTRSGEVSIHN